MPAIRYHDGCFPPTTIDWQKILPFIGPAHAAAARFEGRLHSIPVANVLLSPLSTQEAVLSSRIEGTQASFSEVLEFEATDKSTEPKEKIADIQEVLNYRAALKHAEQLMDSLPLAGRTIKELHRVLMKGVRGQGKLPGEYRRVQNWIGPPGSTVETARFVPVSAEKIADRMAAWERYLHSEHQDSMVQLAILHAEFEAIHPFMDGNGRLGRLLVPLFLVDKKLLSQPYFYISDYLEKHKDEYYERLLAVSRDNDWTGWCIYFLRALTKQAKSNEAKATAILDLYNEKKDWIVDKTSSPYAVRALDWFFGRPIFKTPDFVAAVDIPKSTANRIVRLVREGGMLIDIRASQGRRPALLAFPELLNIAEGEDAF